MARCDCRRDESCSRCMWDMDRILALRGAIGMLGRALAYLCPMENGKFVYPHYTTQRILTEARQTLEMELKEATDGA
jgi:hypothetical protein